MAFRIENQLALSEEKLKSLCEMRDQAYDQVAKILMFTVSWQGLTENFETVRTDLLEQAKQLVLLERKLAEDSNLLEQKKKEAEIKLRRTDEEIQVKEMELGSIKTQIQDTLAEFNLREKQLSECVFELRSKKQKVEERNRELSLKKEELGLVKMNIEECHQDFCLRKDQLNECSYEIQVKRRELSSIKMQIQDTMAEFNSREKQLNECSIELNSKKEKIEEFDRELSLKKEELGLVKMNLEECHQDFSVRKGQLNECSNEIQVKGRELSLIKKQIQDTMAEFNSRLNERSIELNSKKQKLEEFDRELTLKKEELCSNMNLEECHKEFCLKKDQLNEHIQVKGMELSSIKTQIQDTLAEYNSREKQVNECKIELTSKTQKVEECVRELSLKREELGLVKTNLEECQKEYFLKKNQLNECSNELQMKEKELDLKRKEQKQTQILIEESKKEYDLLKKKMSQIRKSMEGSSKELDSKKLEFSSIKQLIGEYNEELEDKEKKYAAAKNSVDEVAEKLKLKETELKSIEKSLNEKSVKLYVEEKKLDSMQKRNENEEKKLNSLKGAISHHEDRQKELEWGEEQLRSVKLEIKNSIMELESIKKLITKCSGVLESKERNLDDSKKSLEDCCNELTAKEVQQGVIHVICCENLRELQEQKTYCDALKRTMEEREEELQNREKQLEEKVKRLESVKQLNGIPFVDLEQLDCSHSNPACSSSPKSRESASEKSPELLLDDYVTDPNLTIEEVSNTLQFSPDPAKLVLDVMRGSYLQFQDNGSAGLDDCHNVVLLLERLMKISPNINLQVKEIALQQGLLWKENINSKTQNSIEILAFLMFLAVYDLASNFRRDEILILVKTIVHYRQAPEICRAICIMDEIASLTANLIQSKQFLEAARFSKTFELSSKFLPRNILRNHLDIIKMDVLLSVSGCNSFQGQFKTMEKEAVALKTFWECVTDCQLESIFPLESCMQYVAGAGMQGLKERLAHSLFGSAHMSLQPQGHSAQQPMQSRNPYMVSASNPPHHPLLGTGKRPRLDSTVYGSQQGSMPPQYGYQGGYFHGPN